MRLEYPLSTNRLVISEHSKLDLPIMHLLLSDEVSMYYLQDIRTKTIEETEKNLMTAIEESFIENRKKFFFKICDKNNEYIGEIGYTVRFECNEGKNVDFGYFIRKEFWNKGYTFEAANACVKYGFENLGIYKIQTRCIVNNIASEKIMIKLGMKKESYKKKHVLHDGVLKDRVEYALFREEYYQRFSSNNRFNRIIPLSRFLLRNNRAKPCGHGITG